MSLIITSRPSKQQKMSKKSSDELLCNLPNCVISDRILPFVDRSTWDNLVLANREIYHASKNLEAPWLTGELKGLGYARDSISRQLYFSSGGNYMCVLSDFDGRGYTYQRIRICGTR